MSNRYKTVIREIRMDTMVDKASRIDKVMVVTAAVTEDTPADMADTGVLTRLYISSQSHTTIRQARKEVRIIYPPKRM